MYYLYFNMTLFKANAWPPLVHVFYLKFIYFINGRNPYFFVLMIQKILL